MSLRMNKYYYCAFDTDNFSFPDLVLKYKHSCHTCLPSLLMDQIQLNDKWSGDSTGMQEEILENQIHHKTEIISLTSNITISRSLEKTQLTDPLANSIVQLPFWLNVHNSTCTLYTDDQTLNICTFSLSFLSTLKRNCFSLAIWSSYRSSCSLCLWTL